MNRNLEILLGDVATVTMGQSPKGSTYNRNGDGMPLLNGPTEFGAFHPRSTLFTTDSKRECKTGDLIFCVRGSTTGRMNWADRPYSLGRGVCSIRGETASDTKFIRYCLELKLDALLQLLGGATFPNLTRSDLNSFPIPWSSHRLKIAAILSAYDDLIENNARRIAILEEMAQLLYREWFVHFRFPGHEQVKMVDSPLGRIPEGWEVVKFSDIVTLLRRGIKPHEFGDETFAHYSFPAFDTGCMPLLERGETIRSSKYLVDKDDVLLSKLNPRIPRVWLPFPDSDYRAIASTEFLVLLPKRSLTRSYLFSLCRSSEFLGDFAALSLGTSTSHQRVKPQDFLNMDTVLPLQTLIGAFSDLANPMLETIHTLRLKNANLRRTRDLLLPRLISGEVDVSELESKGGGLGDELRP